MEVSQLSNLRRTYKDLERRVQRALNTQVGDSERLAGVQEEVLSYIRAVEQVCGKMLETSTLITSVQHSTRTSSWLKSFRFAAATHNLWSSTWTRRGMLPAILWKFP